MAEIPGPALPCPECRRAGRGGLTRIGNRRRECATCNRWAQNVMRHTRSRLKAKHETEYEMIRLEVESELYPSVIAEFKAEHPLAR